MYFASSSKLRKDLRWATAVVCFFSGALFSIPQPSLAWTPEWVSASSFGGTGTDGGLTVKADREGNRYVIGAFSATAAFPLVATVEANGGHAAQTGSGSKALTSAGGTDAFLAKYDRAGNLEWLAQAGGSGDDIGYDLSFDTAGNVYVTGSFTDSAIFQGANNTTKSVVGFNQTIFIAKYKPSGALAWVQTGTCPFGTNQGYGVALERGTGSIYVTGISQFDTAFSSANGTMHSVAGPGFWHMFLVKYDTAGNFQWGQSNQASPNSIGVKVAVDADSNAYVTGWMEGHVTFHSTDGRDVAVDGFSGPVQSPPDYPDDAFVVKYNENGNVKWVNHIGGYKAVGVDIATSRDGRVSATGYIGNIGDSAQQAATIVTSQSDGKNINLGGSTITRPYNKDVFLATWDEDGELLEARRFGGPKDEWGSGIVYDRHGALILAGVFQDAIKIGGRTLTEKGSFNLFVAQLARKGGSCFEADPDDQQAFNWIIGAEGPFATTFDDGPRIKLSPAGNLLVTGGYKSAAQFGSFRLQSAGGNDGFLSVLRIPGKDDHN